MHVPILVFAQMLAVSDAPASWQTRLDEVESQYNATLALEFIEQARQEDAAILPDALLVLAELYRIDFESLEESQRSERRAIGSKIDALADEALGIVETLAETSHTQRLTADLLGVKIRSNYQAKKYRKRMERAAEKAIELDPNNAAAYVSAAKPYLFADEDHRGDVPHGMRLLEKALELDPHSEKAQLLLAYADELSGDSDRAEQRYASALEANPNCRPAREALLELRSSSAVKSP